ncbi:fatty-acyl-CoA synthase [Syntrophus gentianae]|uniref:Fatty-acyl-CoA synthase n=1 Tax=Syntrophus gentianae TaxID=43775 RepID=A0A1H8B561_9BACT|nr:long-chain fatty acid--CoA ligase [Syntrophus gentianae]SEM77883.1 fatty-acyl-CoA synthase [Syntrophus gentianae]
MNIGQWVYKRAHTHPERPFLQEDNRRYTNREFNERVNRMAHALLKLGVGRGERVAVLMGNCSEFLEIFFACAKTGALMVPLNVRLAVPELLYILKDCSPRTLFYAEEFSEKVGEIRAALSSGDMPVCFRLGGSDLSPDPPLAGVLAESSGAEPLPAEAVTLDDPLFIMYTSGTTGQPKGAVLTHGNVLFGAINTVLGYGINKTYKSLVTAPLFHIGALGAAATPVIYAGGSLLLKTFFSATEALRVICGEKVNYVFAVPVMFQMMTKSELWPEADFSHVHFFIAGGAPMPVDLIRQYQSEKGVFFAQGYGMTEALRLTSLDLEDSIRKAGSVGKEVFHTEIRIIDNSGKEVAPGEPGEILVKGPNVFAGYWNVPEATAEVLKDGWFFTGDMGRRDEEGFLYVIGRKVEMIISSGENIYPAEVERAIKDIPGVKEAAVVGMPDPRRGEVVAAFVLLSRGSRLTEEDLLAGLEGKIAPYKMPKKILFVKDFPRNATGKIMKHELKRQL